MKIISDFHDYYDIGMQNGIDPQLPYRRFRREEAIRFPGIDWEYEDWECTYADWYHLMFFGFAGKIYPCINASLNEATPSFCFRATSLDDSFYTHVTNKRHKYHYTGWRVKDIKNEITEIFEYKPEPNVLGLFEKFKTAIWVWKMGNSTIVINERLNLYEFQKVLPPMQAFQELAMYVGSYLTKPVIEEPPISDKIKAEIKGFDKHSFRKDRQKSK